MQVTYRVVETGEVGQLIPCPCDDPIILEFKDRIRDAFFLRELEPTTHPITDSYPARSSNAKNGVKGRPKGLERETVKKMLQIYRFLETQSEPVYRAAIEKAVGFNCTRPLMCQPSQPKQVTLESLGIAERIPGNGRGGLGDSRSLGGLRVRRLLGGCEGSSLGTNFLLRTPMMC